VRCPKEHAGDAHQRVGDARGYEKDTALALAGCASGRRSPKLSVKYRRICHYLSAIFIFPKRVVMQSLVDVLVVSQ